jgi:hypothetical protein
MEIFTLRYGTCWRVAERQIAFPAHADHRLRLELRHGLITRVWAGKSLSEQELEDLLNQIEADLKDRRIAEFGAEILFAQRPVQGGFRFNSTSMQILPPPNDAPLPQQMPADHPFVLEYPIQAFRSPELRHKRRHKNAVEWTWVLNALLLRRYPARPCGIGTPSKRAVPILVSASAERSRRTHDRGILIQYRSDALVRWALAELYSAAV